MSSRARRGALAALLLALAWVPAARASIGEVATLDGPAPEILELGGVAMASDGTGGLVYRRVEDGHAHVFAARFDGHRWQPPQRVDAGQRFESAWPCIGAADGGRLAVAWAQDGGDGLDSLWAAALPRGRGRFLPPTLVDFTIGEDRATYPSIAMNPAGAALIAYRVVRSFADPALPAGYVSGEVRLARFDGSRWQRLGVPANRDRSAPQRFPSTDNAPRVGLDSSGNGVVAWSEPDDDFVDRVWVRRIFGTRLGVPLAASPLQMDGRLVRGAADGFRVAESDLGRVVVAFRQQPDPGDPGAGPRVYVNQLQDAESGSGMRFDGPELVAAGEVSVPSVATAERDDALLAFARGDAATLAYRPAAGPFALADAVPALAAPAPVAVGGPGGHGVLAVATDDGGGEALVRELDATTTIAERPLYTAFGGAIRELAAAGSGAGDALVAFAQGADGDRQIAAGLVDAPPAPFSLTLPVDWSRAPRPRLSWTAAADALGPVTYIVSVDGRAVVRTRATRYTLPRGALVQGPHAVRVVAIDGAGQRTVGRDGRLRLDGLPPFARVGRRGDRVLATLVDPGGARASGPQPRRSTVDWGDGSSSAFRSRTIAHRYRRPGRYRVTVVAVDRAGNRAVVALLIERP